MHCSLHFLVCCCGSFVGLDGWLGIDRSIDRYGPHSSPSLALTFIDAATRKPSRLLANNARARKRTQQSVLVWDKDFFFLLVSKDCLLFTDFLTRVGRIVNLQYRRVRSIVPRAKVDFHVLLTKGGLLLLWIG